MMSVANKQTELNVSALRRDFPLLARTVHGRPLAYLDNAATAQKPDCVIKSLQDYYQNQNSNVHRGVHTLSEEATAHYEEARDIARDFLNARSTREIVFVRGTTEGINLVANSFGNLHLRTGQEILISESEHHSNIVPWQLLCERTGAKLKWIPIDDRGEWLLDDLDSLINENTALIALGHVSNALGTINPIKTLIDRGHAVGARTVIDGAQAVPHLGVDVQALGCDFYVFSAHKLFGPTGIGVLYGKESLLEDMPPWQGGGDMIRTVSLSGSTWHDLPWKFEAGTPNIAGALGMGSAIKYVENVGLKAIATHERALLEYATAQAEGFPGLRLIGTACAKAAILSFTIEDMHPHDIGTIIDQEGIAVRTGHHCAMPVMERFGLSATVRASFAFYNSFEEVDRLMASLHKCREILG
ncbi:MAG: cysteine desulfurase [Candidatus Eutrophobiaceae bacterium]